MAEPVNYSGYTYAADLYRQPTETMIDYMQRLAKQRAAGVLGGGGMLDTPEPITETDPVLGTVTQSCPAGFTLQNGACVRVGGGDTVEDIPQVSNEERYKGMRDLLDNPDKAAAIRALMPFGTGHMFLSDNQIEGYVRNAQNEATKAQGFFDYLGGSDGDVVTGTIDRSWWDRAKEFLGGEPEAAPEGYVIGPDGKSYAPIGGSGSLVTGKPSIVESMFSNFTNNIPVTENVGKVFDPRLYTKDPEVIAAYKQGIPANPSPVLPTVLSQGMLGNAVADGNQGTWTTQTPSDSSYGDSISVYSPSSWSADNTSSWDTSGGGTNADGSYDISSWFK